MIAFMVAEVVQLLKLDKTTFEKTVVDERMPRNSTLQHSA
jgi:hypothetical protein